MKKHDETTERKQRLACETPESRVARLEHMSNAQQLRLATETPEQKEWLY